MNAADFGVVAEGWAGFVAEHKFSLGPFGEATVFLGEEFDEDGEEIDTPPSFTQLSEYAATLGNLRDNFDDVLAAIKESAFQRYHRLYAHYYEQPFTVESFFEIDAEPGSDHQPLGIDSADKHFVYMMDLNYVRITDGGVIRLPILYKLDREHGLEIKLVNNTVNAVGGIAET